ncbi:hypothetical protein KY289_023328 [Solanum tuberosum]|nr:hypothetical protein KY289_023328 [Solanum tuberosum]
MDSTKKDEDKLNSTKCEIYEAKEENERLKRMLSKMVKDYKSLQMHFQGILTQKNSKNNIIATSNNIHEEKEQVELVSLSLGRSSSTSRELIKELLYDDKNKSNKKHSKLLFDGLELGLDCKFTQENSFEELKKENINNERPILVQNYPPSKMDYCDEEFLQQIPQKKARVSIRAVCGTTTNMFFHSFPPNQFTGNMHGGKQILNEIVCRQSNGWRERYLGILNYSVIVLWVLENAEIEAAA